MRSEAELAAALADAVPGAVIAIDGFYSVGDVFIRTDDLTLTCAVPGSGLQGRHAWVVVVFARRATVEGLVLDATGSSHGAFFAHFDASSGEFGEDPRFLRNTVTCTATDLCVFFGSPDASAHGGLVVDNHITVAGGGSGIQVQGVDGGRVERNTVLATGPSGEGIRANGDQHIVVSDNTVLGPWLVSLHFFDGVIESVAERNRLEGARDDAVALSFVGGMRFAHNQVVCGPGTCLFLTASPRAVIVDNRFESAGSVTGVHLQSGIDGTRVERNTIVATAPSTGPVFGGLRVRDGANVVIAGNTVRGPWANSLALADLASSSVEHNDLAAAAAFGILARSGVSLRPISMTDNVFRNNQISGAGSAAIFLTSACRNQLFGNNLQGNADDVGAVFDVPTGANIMVGNKNVVIDNGSFDCDGDGIVDPNTIGAPGGVRHGVAFGRPADDPGASASGRLR